jgi:hypothetical protein
MEFKSWLENWQQEIENASGYENIVTILRKNRINQMFIPPRLKKKILVFQANNELYIIDDFDCPNPKQAEYWIGEMNPEEYIGSTDFNQDFWQQPDILYHGTTEANWKICQEQRKIKPRNVTRGLRNKYIGAAIFTSTSYDTTKYYYPVILQINTKAMKADNYMPEAEPEPDVKEANDKATLASAIGLDDYDYETENDPATVIFRQEIPLKYVKRIQQIKL